MILNFEGHFDPDATSIRRAREKSSEFTKFGNSRLVAFEDSEEVHDVQLQDTVDGPDGMCWIVDHDGERTGPCPGLEYHDGPCAHLWLVRSQCFRPVLADGGHVEAPAAGHDERTFGRPELVR